MGAASTALADRPEGIFWNPGGIAALRTMTWWSAHSRPFGLKELANTATILVAPFSPGVWAFGLHTCGYALYRETTALVSCAGAMTSRVRVGGTLRVLRLDIRDFRSAGAVAFDFGFVGRVGSRFDWGMCLWNVGGARMAGETLSRVLSMGWTFRPAPDAVVVVDVRKELTALLETRVGLEYAPIRSLRLRMGMHDSPSSFSLGMGWCTHALRVDYAVYTHLRLGWSHQMAIHLIIGSPAPDQHGGGRQICP